MLSVIWRTWVWKNGGKSERWDSLHSARYMEEGEGEFKRNKCVQDLMEWDDLETRDNRGNTALIIREACTLISTNKNYLKTPHKKCLWSTRKLCLEFLH